MAELERNKIVELTYPIEDKEQKTSYEKLELKAPNLRQAEQFYEKQQALNSLAAMRLLISLVSGVRENALQAMDYVDFRKCEDYLTGFLTWKS